MHDFDSLVADAQPREDRFIEISASRAFEGRSLNADQIRAVSIPVYATLTGASPARQVPYRVPKGFSLRLKGILPHVRIVDPSAEAVANIGSYTAGTVFTSGLVVDRLAAKMMNCRVALRTVNDDAAVFQSKAMPLFDLSSFAGSKGLSFKDMPNIRRSLTEFELSVSLRDTGAAGSATEYGVLLVGAFVREGS